MSPKEFALLTAALDGRIVIDRISIHQTVFVRAHWRRSPHRKKRKTLPTYKWDNHQKQFRKVA